jgi:hypothetical protein
MQPPRITNILQERITQSTGTDQFPRVTQGMIYNGVHIFILTQQDANSKDNMRDDLLTTQSGCQQYLELVPENVRTVRT